MSLNAGSHLFVPPLEKLSDEGTPLLLLSPFLKSFGTPLRAYVASSLVHGEGLLKIWLTSERKDHVVLKLSLQLVKSNRK